MDAFEEYKQRIVDTQTKKVETFIKKALNDEEKRGVILVRNQAGIIVEMELSSDVPYGKMMVRTVKV